MLLVSNAGEMFRKDGLITPEIPWDLVLNTGQNQVAGKNNEAGKPGSAWWPEISTTAMMMTALIRDLITFAML